MMLPILQHENEVVLVQSTDDGRIIPTRDYDRVSRWMSQFGTQAHYDTVELQIARQRRSLP